MRQLFQTLYPSVCCTKFNSFTNTPQCAFLLLLLYSFAWNCFLKLYFPLSEDSMSYSLYIKENKNLSHAWLEAFSQATWMPHTNTTYCNMSHSSLVVNHCHTHIQRNKHKVSNQSIIVGIFNFCFFSIFFFKHQSFQTYQNNQTVKNVLRLMLMRIFFLLWCSGCLRSCTRTMETLYHCSMAALSWCTGSRRTARLHPGHSTLRISCKRCHATTAMLSQVWKSGFIPSILSSATLHIQLDLLFCPRSP